MAIDEKASPGWAGWVIGMAVGAAVLVFLPLTGASLNAARTFGPYLAAEAFGGEAPWSQLPLYFIGPFIGGGVAAFSYQLLLLRPEDDEAADEA